VIQDLSKRSNNSYFAKGWEERGGSKERKEDRGIGETAGEKAERRALNQICPQAPSTVTSQLFCPRIPST